MFESTRGRDLLQLSRPALGPIQPPVQWVPGLPGLNGWGVALSTHPYLPPTLEKESSYTCTHLLALNGILEGEIYLLLLLLALQPTVGFSLLSDFFCHSPLSSHFFLHRLSTIICKSSSMPAIHHFRGLPLVLGPVGELYLHLS